MQVASCDARPRTREESNPRPAGSGSRRANHETTPVRTAKNLEFLHLDHADSRRGLCEHRRNRKTTSSFCTSTTPIPAEGRASMLEIAKKNMGFCTSTTPIPAEGRAGMLEIAKKPWVFAPRPRRSPQRVARACWKSQKKNMGFCTSTTPIPTEGRAGTLEIAKNHGFLHLDHADPRRGSREHRRNRKKKHGFLHLDHADPRRGSIFV